jgi:quercetin dioxygenase-like cupin family protein
MPGFSFVFMTWQEKPMELPLPKNSESADALAFPWGEIRWLSNSEIDPAAEMTFGVVTILPGERNDLHAHPNCEEVIFVMSGACDHRLEDAVYPLTPGSALRIPRNTWHNATVTSEEPCHMVIAYSSPDRQTILKK